MNKAPYYKLLGALAECGIKHKEIAEMLGITPTTFSNKINRKNADFTAPEMKMICDRLGVDSNSIFLN